MSEKHVPIRTCIGCGKKAPQTELYRLGEGRGAYLCRSSEECFQKAMKKKAFSRALRKQLNDGETRRIKKEYISQTNKKTSES